MSTEIDLETAFTDFVARIEENKTRVRINNDKLPAGSPMHYDCAACQGHMERDEDDFGPRQKHCAPCSILQNAGVLDEFIARASKQAA